MRRATLACALALCIAPGPASAQLFAPGAAADVTRALDVLAASANGRTELVLQPAYVRDEPAPALAWILAVPSPARTAGPSPDGLFEALEPSAAPPSIAARYAVQRVEGRGPDAAARLARWLEDGGFSPPPAAPLDYYAARGWSFVAVRVTSAGGGPLPAAGRLPPLHLSFASDRVVVPLRFSSAPRASLRVFVWSAEPPGPGLADGAIERGLRGEREDGAARWRTLEALPAALARTSRDAFGALPRGTTHLARFEAPSLGRLDPSRWPEELSFPPLPPERTLTAFAPAPARDASEALEPRRAAQGAGARGGGCRAASSGSATTPAALGVSLVWAARRRRRR